MDYGGFGQSGFGWIKSKLNEKSAYISPNSDL